MEQQDVAQYFYMLAFFTIRACNFLLYKIGKGMQGTKLFDIFVKMPLSAYECPRPFSARVFALRKCPDNVS
jgi:hypothetical protein